MKKDALGTKDFKWLPKIGGIFRSRAATRAKNNLGIIDITNQNNFLVRNQDLEKLDSYYESRQYNHLMDWDEACSYDDYVGVRQRKPRINYPYVKNLADRLGSKLVGDSVFPKFNIQGSPDDQAFLQAVIRESNLKFYLQDPIKRMVATGASFVRYRIVDGKYNVEWFLAKYCYPVFKENKELESVTVKYVYVDENEFDDKGNPVTKWFKLELTETTETLYDNPIYEKGVEPVFEVVDQVVHNLGFVQGQWFKDSEATDGKGFAKDILEFSDEFSYSLSQSSQAVSYNQDPQLAINGLDEEETALLIRSAAKSWNLGREGKAGFVESNLVGVERALQMRDKVSMNISDITRITILDPEKIVGSAQSAKAMEVLHGPMKDLVDELRLIVGPQIRDLVIKMAVSTLMAARQGILSPIDVDGYKPKSLSVEIKWPALFQQTIEDLAKKVGATVAAKNGRIISTITAIKFIAEEFNIEDVEAEAKLIEAEVAAEAALNPFGGF